MTPYYADDQVTLYLGDCREVLPALEIAPDLVVADPPYGETSLPWDRWPEGWPASVAKVARAMWTFGPLRVWATPPYRGPEFATAGWRLSQDVDASWVIWEKHNASGPNADRFRRVHEPVSFWYRGRWADVYRDPQRITTGVIERGRVVRQGPKETAQRGTYRTGSWTDDGTRLATSIIRARSMHRASPIHPTEKPVDLLDPLIRYGCPPGGLVLDPFAGSGSTLDAARRSGRRAVGIEAHEPYVEAAARRLSAGDLFTGPESTQDGAA